MEFYDIPTAESAIRNLGGSELNGRVIRIVYAVEGGPVDSSRSRRDEGGAPFQGPPEGYRPGRSGVRNKTIGADLAYHSSLGMDSLIGKNSQVGEPADQLTLLLARKTRSELYEYLAQMQYLLHQNPQQAKQILLEHPLLTRALFQMEIILGMVNNPLGDIAPKGIAPPGALPQKTFDGPHGYGEAQTQYGSVPSSVGGPQTYYSHSMQPETQQYLQQDSIPHAPIASVSPPSDPRLASGIAPVPAAPMTSAPRPMVSLTAATTQVAPVQQPTPAPVQSATLQGISAEQQALLQQVISLTPEQIEMLPAEQKAQVIALQKQLGMT